MTDRMQSSSGPRDGSNMESPPRPVEMSIFPRTQGITGLPDVSLGLLATSSFVPDRAVLGSYGPQVGTLSANPLAQWYETNDGPWIPKDIALPRNGGQQSSRMSGVSIRNNGYNFSGSYRESISISECDTVPPGIMPSDSGYGSNGAKQSVATGSVYDEALERNQETQSITGHLSELNFQGFSMGWSQQQPQPPMVQRSAQLDGKELRCETCNKELRTNSELKKHRQRHTKPYTCEVPGCRRTEGFSTTNDLDRHKRSVHPELGASGNRYRCSHGSCSSKDKIWPRADNFRAHVKRVHSKEIGDDDLEFYICRATLPPSQDVLTGLVGMQTPTEEYSFQLSPSTEAGFPGGYWQQESNQSAVVDITQETSTDTRLHYSQVGNAKMSTQVAECAEAGKNTGMGRLRNEQGTLSRALGSFTSPREPPKELLVESSTPIHNQREGEPSRMQYISPEELSHHAATAPASSLSEPGSPIGIKQSSESPRSSQDFLHSHSAEDSGNNNGTDNDMEVLRGPYSKKKQSTPPRTSHHLELSATGVSPLMLDLNDRENMKQILELLQTNGVLKTYGYKKETSPASEEIKKTESMSSPGPEPQNACPTCHKKFVRRCELRKHTKRHEKPYGCTFSGCNKRFGSKNDWKRHENSQHFFLEVWRCDEKKNGQSSDTCGKACHRRETFKQHLTSNHQLSSPAIERKLEECHVGRNCEARFWCGFCLEIIEIKEKGVHAWTERFDHIDNHFSGRNDVPKKHIDDWKDRDQDASRVVDASVSDSSDESSLSSTSSPNKTTSGRDARGRKRGTRTASVKRKASDADEGHVPKRRKSGSPIMRVTNCCECGEINQSTLKMGQQCISSSCQHLFCSNCR